VLPDISSPPADCRRDVLQDVPQAVNDGDATERGFTRRCGRNQQGAQAGRARAEDIPPSVVTDEKRISSAHI
jgi:hypothetical protein